MHGIASHRLFYTMLHASRNWKQNKWWLFDRVVESPHRTAFFVRKDVEKTNPDGDNMREAAQYWYVTCIYATLNEQLTVSVSIQVQWASYRIASNFPTCDGRSMSDH